MATVFEAKKEWLVSAGGVFIIQAEKDYAVTYSYSLLFLDFEADLKGTHPPIMPMGR